MRDPTVNTTVEEAITAVIEHLETPISCGRTGVSTTTMKPAVSKAHTAVAGLPEDIIRTRAQAHLGYLARI
jgi:hypothetical protein